MNIDAVADDAYTIAIVGMGPRGLSVLERLLVRLTEQTMDRPVRIFAVDPGEPGAGRIWRTNQPEWLKMNTPAGEVTLYSNEPDGGPARAGAGPSLYQWLRGYPDPTWANVGPNGYVPRAVYGEYLHSVFQNLTANLPPGVMVHSLPAQVTRIQRKGDEYLLYLDRRSLVPSARKVILCTGHPRTFAERRDREFLTFAAGRPGLRYLQGDSAADLDLDSIRASDTVGIIGLGLSFYDVLSCLTEGRGGRFEKDSRGDLRYVPSGSEPRIVAGSRSGLPLPARGRNQKTPHYRYQPLFLTVTALAQARQRRLAERGSPQLDFRDDVLPLLRLEIEHVYYAAQVRMRQGDEVATLFAKRHLAVSLGELGTLEGSRAELLNEFDVADVAQLDLMTLARPFSEQLFASPTEFHRSLLDLLRKDLDEAERGNVDGPVKAALDIMRDIRGVMRSAVDFSGLLPASHRHDFLTWFNPLNSLLSAGPPAIRIAQLRALVEAGTLTIAGPDARFEVDSSSGRFVIWSPQVAGSRRTTTVLIDARIPRPSVRGDASPLTRQLLADGVISEYVNTDPISGDRFHTGGLAITESPFHVVDAFGRATAGLYALGIPTENTRWFTQIGNGRPGPIGGFHGDADAIATDVLLSVPVHE